MLPIVELFDALPRNTSNDIALRLVTALFWYQIYFIESRIQHIRKGSMNHMLCLKTFGTIQDIELKWLIINTKVTTKLPMMTWNMRKHQEMQQRVFHALKTSLQRVEKGGRWLNFSGKTPASHGNPEYLELLYRIISIENAVGALDCFVELKLARCISVQGKGKVQLKKPRPTTILQKHNYKNIIRIIDDALDILSDTIMFDVNECARELEKDSKQEHIKAGLKVLKTLSIEPKSIENISQAGKVNVLTDNEKRDLVMRLNPIIEYLLELFHFPS